MQVFISHSSKEADIANKMCDKLEQSGYTCFIAPRNIRSGYVYAEELANGVNGYNTEKGFLCGFTDEELAVIKTTEVATKGNVLSEMDTVVTQDKVFLLSMDELEWFVEADVSVVAS